jgi:succinate-acetate transporter protein
MIKKLELAPKHEAYAEPTALGLIGLAIGCAALTPIAFGHALTPAGLKTAAMFCLLFGGGCQLVAGLMNFANKNLFGGTVLTAFSFNWIMNWWALHSTAEAMIVMHATPGGPPPDMWLAGTMMPDHTILLATDVVSLLIFLVITYGFGFFSKLLAVFLLDIDLLYACKVYKGFFPTQALNIPIAVLTVALGGIALWIAFATLINPTANRPVFRIPGPLFHATKKASFDWSLRNAMFTVLFEHWSVYAFKTMSFEDLKLKVQAKVGDKSILPDLAYLMELGAVVVTTEEEKVVNIRLSASGIDLYEQLILKKYDF